MLASKTVSFLLMALILYQYSSTLAKADGLSDRSDLLVLDFLLGPKNLTGPDTRLDLL